MKITEYENTLGEAMILVEYEDGSSWSGFKAVWEEQQKAAELGGTF